MDDAAKLQYARLRTLLDVSMKAAARQAGIKYDAARRLEADDDQWQPLVDKARSVDDIDSMCIAARGVIMDAINGENEQLPEHTRVQTAKWFLGRADPDLSSPEYRKINEAKDSNPLEDFDEDELREMAEQEEEVVLDVES